MRRIDAVVVVSVLALVAGCAPPGADVEAEGEALMERSRSWSELAQTGDVDSMMAYWAEDAVMMPPGMPPLEGKAAIREFVEEGMSAPGFEIRWEPRSVHVARSGDLAYMLERNVMTVNDSLGNPVTTHGKVVTVWRKGPDGTWRNVVDMWNEAPPPGS